METVKEVRVRLKDREYSIFIQRDSLPQIGQCLVKTIPSKDVFVVSDQNVSDLYGDPVMESLKTAGFRTEIGVVAAGEASKSLHAADFLYTKLIEFQLKRDGTILALGGGVVGDLAGFVASTYLRGVSLVQIPTTLLSQVDSSVGGKVGINHRLGKNMIGNFYQPRMVLIDPSTLKTLDAREVWSGMAEVLKYSLIADASLFSVLQKNLNAITDMTDDDLLLAILYRCCQIKANFVEEDEKESGVRRLLNFGHTLGHAFEALGGFQYFKHGEAIVPGMLWAVWLSQQKGFLNTSQAFQIRSLLEQFPVPHIPENIQTVDLIDKVQMDKKQSSDGLCLVLLKEIGKAIVEKTHLEPWMIEQWRNRARL